MGVVATLRNEPQGPMTPLHIAGIRGNLEIVSLLLDSGMRTAQSNFEDMINSNCRDGVAIMTSILKAQPDLSITDGAVSAATRNGRTKDFVKYFLNCGFLSSKARLLLVLKNWQEVYREADPGRLMKALLNHGEGIGCNGREFFNAVIQCSYRQFGSKSHLELVLERYEPFPLNQHIMECIASDTVGGVDMLRCLCRKYKGISFSQDDLAAAAEKENGMQLMDIILEHDETLNISQLVLQAAGRGLRASEKLLVMMYHNKSLEIMGEFLKSIWPWWIVRVLMSHEDCRFRSPSEKPSVAKAFGLLDSHIWSHEDCKVAVSEQMVNAAARWEADAIDYLQSHARPNVTFRKYALEE